MYAIKSEFLVKYIAVFFLLGKGYEYLFWDAPLRAFFWNESFLSPFIECFTTWENYASSPYVNETLNFFNRVIAILFLFNALIIFFEKKGRQYVYLLTKINLVISFFLLLCYFKENFYRIGYLLEHSSQFLSLFVYLLFALNILKTKRLLILKLIAAATFIGHGLYAIGFYPVPGNFIDMVIYILHVDEDTSLVLLKMAGFTDIVVGLLVIFFEVRYTKFLYLFMIFWGTWTSIARSVFGLLLSFSISSVHEEWFKMAYRFPHALIPLLILVYFNETKLKSLKID